MADRRCVGGTVWVGWVIGHSVISTIISKEIASVL